MERVTLDEAIRLKELGFNEPTAFFFKCFGDNFEVRPTHIENGVMECDNWNEIDTDFPIDDSINTKHVSAPTRIQAIQFLFTLLK